MKIKICEANREKLRAAFSAANGRAYAQTATATAAFMLATDAEKRLERAGVKYSSRPGARATEQSGAWLPAAYKHKAPARTTFSIVRGAANAWYLTEVSIETGRRTPRRLEITISPAAVADVMGALGFSSPAQSPLTAPEAKK